jgi:hypothetical protein
MVESLIALLLLRALFELICIRISARRRLMARSTRIAMIFAGYPSAMKLTLLFRVLLILVLGAQWGEETLAKLILTGLNEGFKTPIDLSEIMASSERERPEAGQFGAVTITLYHALHHIAMLQDRLNEFEGLSQQDRQVESETISQQNTSNISEF